MKTTEEILEKIEEDSLILDQRKIDLFKLFEISDSKERKKAYLRIYNITLGERISFKNLSDWIKGLK